MSSSSTHNGLFEPTAPPRGSFIYALQLLSRRILGPLIMFWMVAGGFVLIEPSPYEFVFLMVLPVALMAGVGLHRSPQIILYLLILFVPFGFIGAFHVTHMSVLNGMVYVLVTVFLWLTSYFVANYVADDPQNTMTRMMKAYTFIAVVVSLIGSLAYLGLIPGEDVFTKFGRAKGTFEDPNVFGPFLILPAMFAFQKLILTDRPREFWLASIVFGILAVGVLFSFSRAAWGHFIISAAMVFVCLFIFEATSRIRQRMLILMAAGFVLAVIGLGFALSIESVRELFLQRASFVQSYDSGETGRFGRQAYAFELALANPWGIGPLEFENMRITEEPHNTYVKVLLTYGWVGGFAYMALVWLTLKRGFSALVSQKANRLLLIPTLSVFAFLVIESAIIDTDHWRHYFLVLGMVWGITAYSDREQPPPPRTFN